MSIFSLSIELSNAAFDNGDAGSEVARLLRELAARVDGDDFRHACAGRIHDISGNTVGHWHQTERKGG